MMAPMRARPRRAPTTAPAIKALEVPLLLLPEPFGGNENAVLKSANARSRKLKTTYLL
jgi:hypothetical protein